MALRRNKDTGAWERQQPDGTWLQVADKGAPPPVAASPSQGAGASSTGVPSAPASVGTLVAEPDTEDDGLSGLDAALQAAFDGGSQNAGLEPAGGDSNGRIAVASPVPAPIGNGASPAPVPPVDTSPASTGVSDDDGMVEDIPGLTSGDGSRSTVGSKGVRERLMARRGTGHTAGATRRVQEPTVTVSPRAARASGPAVRDSTEARARSRAQSGAGTGRRGAQLVEARTQRYVTKPPPALLSARPRWVQDLFEAHFRSDLTLAMRKEFNRMKLSRQDYAIGWLTLLDKIKEDPAILRLRGGTGLSGSE